MRRALAGFLILRWLRLTPLFAALAAMSVLMFSVRAGQAVDRLALRAALNLSYAFGWYDPVVWSLPISGWSLGIEFGDYLLFPLLVWGVSQRACAGRCCAWRLPGRALDRGDRRGADGV